MVDPADAKKVKLVFAVGATPWAGVIYPTQRNKGRRIAFDGREELIAAVAELSGWDGQPDT